MVLMAFRGRNFCMRVEVPSGVVTSTILELVIYPAIYVIWKERELRREITTTEEPRTSC